MSAGNPPSFRTDDVQRQSGHCAEMAFHGIKMSKAGASVLDGFGLPSPLSVWGANWLKEASDSLSVK